MSDASWARLTWKVYAGASWCRRAARTPNVGEEADAAESEDEDYLGVKADGYTREEMIARQSKLAAIDKFEARVAAERAAKGIDVVRPPTHRAPVASVRPNEGAEVTATYMVRSGAETVADGKREVVVVGQPGGETWQLEIDKLLRDMRRGEVLRYAADDGSVYDVELGTVREERRLSPSASSAWAELTRGSVHKRRLVYSATPGRPTWGDVALVKWFEDPPVGARVEAVMLALIEEAPREIVVGAGVEREGLETAVAAMKRGEACIVTVQGEQTLTETDAIAETADASTSWTAAVLLVDIRRRSRNEDAAEEDALKLKKRGGELAKAGRWRRAEALYSRAIARLDETYSSRSEIDRTRVEDDLVVPLLLNIAVCARKRAAPRDEDVLITKALRLKHGQDVAFKAKAYVRRAAARVDLARWAEARDDLRLAAQNARLEDDKAVLNDCRRQLARLKDQRKTDRQTAEKKFAGAKAAFCDVVEIADDEPASDAAPRKAPLLYEKEIADRLKAQKPWDYDP